MQQNIKEPKVCILLSSYNGSKYIREQVNSILSQTGVNIELVIRDDGSTDDTIEIIESYGGEIKLLKGNNVGCEQSFATLLNYSSDADYYAFSDQDDYWLPDKVLSEIKAIQDIEGPALAACNLLVCDGDLTVKNTMHSADEIKAIKKKMEETFLCNMHGCVLLWNRKLHEKLCNNVPENIISHDGWVNTIANSIGKVVIIEDALIRYRIHDNNVAGHASTLVERAKKGFRIYLGEKHPKRDVLAKEAIIRFGSEMDKNSSGYNTLEKIANYKNSMSDKIKLLNNNVIKRSPFPDRLLWILCVLMNTY